MGVFGVPISLVLAIGVPELLGSLIGGLTSSELDWFATQRKPAWQPPGPLFGVAWTILYAIIGYASWRVWLQGGWQAHQKTLTLYAVQLALNLSWPIVFFKKKQLGAAQGVNLVLLALVALTTSAFYKVDPLAGKLFLPYLAWVAFANAINYSVWKKNPQATSAVESLGSAPGRENPGESRYNKPASASLGSGTQTANVHSRRQVVSVRCMTQQARISKPAHVVRKSSPALAVFPRAVLPAAAAQGYLKQACILR